ARRDDRGHVLPDRCLEQAGGAGELDGSAEHLRGAAEPEGALIRRGGAGEGVGVRTGGPATPPFEDHDRNPRPGQPQGGDAATESTAHHQDAVLLDVVWDASGAARVSGERRRPGGGGGGRGDREPGGGDGAEKATAGNVVHVSSSRCRRWRAPLFPEKTRQ